MQSEVSGVELKLVVVLKVLVVTAPPVLKGVAVSAVVAAAVIFGSVVVTVLHSNSSRSCNSTCSSKTVCNRQKQEQLRY